MLRKLAHYIKKNKIVSLPNTAYKTDGIQNKKNILNIKNKSRKLIEVCAEEYLCVLQAKKDSRKTLNIEIIKVNNYQHRNPDKNIGKLNEHAIYRKRKFERLTSIWRDT